MRTITNTLHIAKQKVRTIYHPWNILVFFPMFFPWLLLPFHSWGTYSCLLCGWSCSTGSVIDQCCQCLRSMGILEKWNGQRCPSCYLYSGLLRRVACDLLFWRLRMRQRFYRCLSYFGIYMVFWIFRRPISHEAHLVLWCTLHISKLLAALRMRERRKDYNMKCCTTWDV